MDSGTDLTIMLLGNTGVGKSASGNTILGCKAFESKPSFKSVTRKISEATENVFGKQISVIDTPGISGFKTEIKSWCQDLLKSSRPYLFLVVVSVGRFTEEQEKAVRETMSLLRGLKKGLEKSYILFTNGDGLKDKTVDDFIYEDDESSLPGIVQEFGGKYHLFNNETGGQEQVKQLLVKSGHLQTLNRQSHLAAACREEDLRLSEIRIVLIGLPGGGKSSSANTILGAERFRSGCDFDPVSTETVSVSAEVEGHQVTVIDTPGFTDEVPTPEQLYLEIMKTLTVASPGPHAFVIVVRIGKMSKADKNLLQMLQQLFGRDAKLYTMVLFTHGDELGGRLIEEMIQSNTFVSDLVSMCADRFCVFDNKGRKTREQVKILMSKIDEIVAANEGKHYTSEMFRMAETFIREAERIQHDQAVGTNETPQQTAQTRLTPCLMSYWRKLAGCFFPCCFQSRTDSDDETQPFLQ